MSADDTIDPASGGNLIAAEYVLGVLGAEERREVERRLAQEPALASEVAFWEERLGGIADAVAPVAPPPHAWSQIEAAIAADARPQAAVVAMAEHRVLARLRHRRGDARGRQHRGAGLYRAGARRRGRR